MKIGKTFGGLVLAATLTTGIAATPAEAHGRGHHRHQANYDNRGYDDGYNRYNSSDRYDRNERRDYRDRRDYRNNRCSNGTGGTIIGAVAGGLVGDRVARRGSRTEGTIIGAAIGALGGRALDKASSRCR